MWKDIKEAQTWETGKTELNFTIKANTPDTYETNISYEYDVSLDMYLTENSSGSMDVLITQIEQEGDNVVENIIGFPLKFVKGTVYMPVAYFEALYIKHNMPVPEEFSNLEVENNYIQILDENQVAMIRMYLEKDKAKEEETIHLYETLFDGITLENTLVKQDNLYTLSLDEIQISNILTQYLDVFMNNLDLIMDTEDFSEEEQAIFEEEKLAFEEYKYDISQSLELLTLLTDSNLDVSMEFSDNDVSYDINFVLDSIIGLLEVDLEGSSIQIIGSSETSEKAFDINIADISQNLLEDLSILVAKECGIEEQIYEDYYTQDVFEEFLNMPSQTEVEEPSIFDEFIIIHNDIFNSHDDIFKKAKEFANHHSKFMDYYSQNHFIQQMKEIYTPKGLDMMLENYINIYDQEALEFMIEQYMKYYMNPNNYQEEYELRYTNYFGGYKDYNLNDIDNLITTFIENYTQDEIMIDEFMNQYTQDEIEAMFNGFLEYHICDLCSKYGTFEEQNDKLENEELENIVYQGPRLIVPMEELLIKEYTPYVPAIKILEAFNFETEYNIEVQQLTVILKEAEMALVSIIEDGVEYVPIEELPKIGLEVEQEEDKIAIFK
ncbi:hypothetical protein AN639_07735 [Candidatus Epulonipiscium fishelsonii]|nr:hypothetical protein AN639_07735 [Epulopiscium sp. SCG-B05WGA-EpuloA1]